MSKRRLLVIGTVAVAVLGVSFALSKSNPPPIPKLHLVKAWREGGAVAVTYEIAGNPGSQYCLTVVRMEIKDEAGWKKCPASISGFFEPPDAGNTNSRSDFYFSPQGSGTHLRLVVDVQKARPKGIPSWLKLKFLGRKGQIPVNPFGDNLVFTKEAAGVICDEFVEP